MAMSPYLAAIRKLVGHRLLCLPSVTGVVSNADGDILLVRNSGATEWTIPGGYVEPKERPAEAIVRELKEELGLEVKVKALLGVFSGPEYCMVYPNSDEVVAFTAVFDCELVKGTPKPDLEELAACRFVSRAAMANIETPEWVDSMMESLERGEAFD